MNLQYNPLENNFMVYESSETPKVEINLPLIESPLDISDWASSIKDNGTIIAKPNLPKMTNNNKVLEISNENPNITLENSNQSLDTSKLSISTNIKGDKKKAMEFFLNKGLSAHAAAGIVGNLIVESGLQTGIKGDGGKALGLAQWHPDRLKGLRALAKSRGTSISDFETLLEWVWQELNNSERRALDKLMSAKNVKEAAVSFMKYYERPGIPHTERRIKEAQSLLS